jgi:hypothetical protein
MIVSLSPFQVPRRSGTAVCDRAAVVLKTVKVAIEAIFDVADIAIFSVRGRLSSRDPVSPP